MSAFLKMEGIPGQATDDGHKEWILIESMSSPIFRSIPAGAKDNQRTAGDTTIGDVVVVRSLDKSSTKLQEACANGTLFKEVLVHFTAQINNKQELYLEYKLANVIVSSYSFHGNASGSPLPSEEVTMNCSEAEWTYHTIDPETGKNKGKVAAKYSLGKGKS